MAVLTPEESAKVARQGSAAPRAASPEEPWERESEEPPFEGAEKAVTSETWVVELECGGFTQTSSERLC